MLQKYSGIKALTKVLVELTGKLVEMHSFKKTVDKASKITDLQQLTGFKKSMKLLNGAVKL